jgi:hypothetical protein
VPAGCSGTPLRRKLGIRPGHVVAFVGAPEGWTIPDLDPGIELRGDLRRRPDIVIAFVRSRRQLQNQGERLRSAVSADASLWVAWPRKAGGHVSDVTEQSLRDEFLPSGLVDTKVATLDNDWSGLRFVWRRDCRASISGRDRG